MGRTEVTTAVVFVVEKPKRAGFDPARAESMLGQGLLLLDAVFVTLEFVCLLLFLFCWGQLAEGFGAFVFEVRSNTRSPPFEPHRCVLRFGSRAVMTRPTQISGSSDSG